MRSDSGAAWLVLGSVPALGVGVGGVLVALLISRNRLDRLATMHSYEFIPVLSS